MADRSLWDVLGLAETADKAQIRRAYSAQLKVVHPEDDAEGFQALRAAYEQAMALADRGQGAAPRPAAIPGSAPAPMSEPGEAARAASWRPATGEVSAEATRRDVHDRYRQRLEQLLTAPEPPPEAELTRAVYAVFDPVALADIGAHLDTESWLAGLICRTAPRSDLIIDRAAETFGWNEVKGYVGDRAIAAVISRLEARRQADRFKRLDALLRGAEAPAENTLMGALDAVTDPRVIRDPAQGPQIELWLARLLMETRPRSDPLISTVTRRLAWDVRSRQAKMDGAIEAAAAIAAQIAPRPTRVVRPIGRQAGPGPWIGLVVVLTLLTSMIFTLATHPPAQAPAAASQDVDGYTGPRSQIGGPPRAILKNGRVEAELSASEDADTYLQCDDIAAGQLQGCRVTKAKSNDVAHMVLDYVHTLSFDATDDTSTTAPPIQVHVRWVEPK